MTIVTKSILCPWKWLFSCISFLLDWTGFHFFPSSHGSEWVPSLQHEYITQTKNSHTLTLIQFNPEDGSSMSLSAHNTTWCHNPEVHIWTITTKTTSKPYMLAYIPQLYGNNLGVQFQ
jgi:hypothetical protein